MSSVLSSKKHSLSEDQVNQLIGNPHMCGWTTGRGKVFTAWLASLGVKTRKDLDKNRLEKLNELSDGFNAAGVKHALHYHLLMHVSGTPHDDILLDAKNGRVVLKGGASS